LDNLMPTRPCWVEIHTRFLEENYRFLVALVAPDAELLAIVKADAYGHSLSLCAPAAVRAGARWLGVTCVEEGVAARALCPEARILTIGGVFPGQAAAAVAHRLTAVAWEPWQLAELETAARAAGLAAGALPVHLEIDTGMSRQGVAPEKLSPEAGGAEALLARFAPGSPLRLEGVMTHLFAADEADGRVTQLQLARLDEALSRIEAAGIYPEWLNVGSSAALVAGETAAIAAQAARHGMKTLLRPGLVLYGLTPEFVPRFEPEEPKSLVAARARLQPVLQWKTRVLAPWWATTVPLSPPNRCGWHYWPWATPTGSTAVSATASACWFAARARLLWAASAWISRSSTSPRFPASRLATRS
jgi:alanine racemase